MPFQRAAPYPGRRASEMSCNHDHDHQRRQFFSRGATLTAAVSIAPGLMLYDFARARPAGEAASPAVRWGMLIDTGQCDSGCDACVSACNKENGLSGRTLPTDS